MTTIAHGWQTVSRHKILDAVVVLFVAVAIAVTLALTLGNNSSGSANPPSAGPGPRHTQTVPDCHWHGVPTAC